MEWDAVTFDTSIFVKYQRDLEHPMIQRLADPNESSFRFVLSEVVLREIEDDLNDLGNKARNNIRKAREAVRRTRLMTDDMLERLDELVGETISPEDATRSQLSDFEYRMQMEFVSVEHANIEELVRRYFDRSAPFRAAGKKNEFPDAIALLSLEKWAEMEQKKILAVSEDSDWAEFAKGSAYIDVEADLARAIEKLRQYEGNAKAELARIFSEMNFGKHDRLRNQIFDAMANTVQHFDAHGEGNSSLTLEGRPVRFTLQDLRLPAAEDDGELSLVLLDRGQICASVGFVITAKAECEFVFHRHDPFDRMVEVVGRTHAELDGDFPVSALFTFEGTLETSNSKLELTHLDIVDGVDRVDFGELEPDHGKVFHLDRYR